MPHIKTTWFVHLRSHAIRLTRSIIYLWVFNHYRRNCEGDSTVITRLTDVKQCVLPNSRNDCKTLLETYTIDHTTKHKNIKVSFDYII